MLAEGPWGTKPLLQGLQSPVGDPHARTADAAECDPGFGRALNLSCVPCPDGSTSPGGLNATCQACPLYSFTTADASACYSTSPLQLVARCLLDCTSTVTCWMAKKARSADCHPPPLPTWLLVQTTHSRSCSCRLMARCGWCGSRRQTHSASSTQPPLQSSQPAGHSARRMQRHTWQPSPAAGPGCCCSGG